MSTSTIRAGEALQGNLPPTETGLRGATIDALWAVADAASAGQPTDELVAKARAALAAELNT